MNKKYNRIVLNIPHSSDNLCINTWEGDIQKEVEKWTDTFTDVLFAPNDNTLVKPVVCHVSRFFCDVERLINDPLEKRGEGIFYTSFNGCKRKQTHALYSYAMQLWYKHQEMLSNEMCEGCLILDCHSFPNEVAPDVDICIGFNDDWSKPNLLFIENVCKFFEDYGYTVKLNSPYSNSITPHRDFYYNSLMIEINKRLYLKENGEKMGSMYKLNQVLNYLYRNILNEWNC